MTSKEKLQAIRLAYQIISDNRNQKRYAGTCIFEKDGSIFEYSDMVHGLREIAEDIAKEAKQKMVTKMVCEN